MIWMMQGKYEMDLSFLRSEHSDALQVVWGSEPSGRYDDAYYLPRSTCTEGRNYLLQLAYEKGVARGEQVCVFYMYMFSTPSTPRMMQSTTKSYCVCVCVCVYIYIYTYVRTYVRMYVCMYVCMNLTMYTHTHTHMHTCIYSTCTSSIPRMMRSSTKSSILASVRGTRTAHSKPIFGIEKTFYREHILYRYIIPHIRSLYSVIKYHIHVPSSYRENML